MRFIHNHLLMFRRYLRVAAGTAVFELSLNLYAGHQDRKRLGLKPTVIARGEAPISFATAIWAGALWPVYWGSVVHQSGVGFIEGWREARERADKEEEWKNEREWMDHKKRERLTRNEEK